MLKLEVKTSKDGKMTQMNRKPAILFPDTKRTNSGKVLQYYVL